MEKEIKKEYIVLVLSHGSSVREFRKLINCDSYDIKNYVRSLPFGSELCFYFFSIEKLAEIDTMDTGDATKAVVMSNEKTFANFGEEIAKVIDQLQIQMDGQKDE